MSIVIATLVLLAVASSPPCEAWATNQPAREGLILGKVAKANTASSLGLGLNVKSLATTIDCGDNFTLAVTVQDAQLKHARTNRYSSRLHMQVSDGAYFVESSIPGPPPLDTSGDNFTSTFLWTLPKGAKSTYEYRITFLSDICPPPAQINVVATLERLDAKAAWTKHPQSGNVTHETTVSTRAQGRLDMHGQTLARHTFIHPRTPTSFSTRSAYVEACRVPSTTSVTARAHRSAVWSASTAATIASAVSMTATGSSSAAATPAASVASASARSGLGLTPRVQRRLASSAVRQWPPVTPGSSTPS